MCTAILRCGEAMIAEIYLLLLVLDERKRVLGGLLSAIYATA